MYLHELAPQINLYGAVMDNTQGRRKVFITGQAKINYF